MATKSNFWQSFGPGILFAGAAIGTSHMVQSTRAGAMFGLGLLAVIVFANILKYPAFRFGPQYAAATGKSLIDGYRDIGRWVVALYLLTEACIMTIIVAATAIVTAGILLIVTGVDLNARYAAIGLIIFGIILLKIGGFKLLDRVTKVFVLILTIATITTTILVLPRIEWQFTQLSFSISDLQTFGFIIALMGFMPSAMDLSVLQSLWSVAKQQESGRKPIFAHAITDFNIGYFASAALAICFMLMGAGVMHVSGEIPATGAADFAAQVISLFTTILGDWAGDIVAISALFVMFTTLITILDGFPRLLAAGLTSLKENPANQVAQIEKSTAFHLCSVFLSLVATLILLFLMSSFKGFIDFVTITAFIVGPITALLNHIVMKSPAIAPEHKPNRLLTIWSLVAIVIMCLMALAYIYTLFL